MCIRDSEGTGALPKRELWRYLRSFLTTLATLCGTRTDENVRMTSLFVIDNACVELVEAVFKDGDTDQEDRITFAEFADWYTYGGFEVAPWLELLDLNKWPVTSSSLGDTPAESEAEYGTGMLEDEAGGKIASAHPGEIVPYLDYALTSGGVGLSLIHISEPTRPY